MKLKTITIILVVAVLLFSAFALYLRTQTPKVINQTLTNQTPTGKISIMANGTQMKIIGYNNSQGQLVYSLVSYNITNATNATFSMDVYSRNPVTPIYLLNVSDNCKSCFDEPSLRIDLASYLRRYAIIKNFSDLNYVQLGNVSSIPNNSTIIVPSGLLPLYFLNGTVTDVSRIPLFTLLQKGDSIIYVGLNITRTLGPDQQNLVDSPEILNLLNFTRLQTSQVSGQVSQPTGNSRNLTFKNPTFIFSSGTSYGNLTYAEVMNGSFIAFPNYPTRSWNNVEAMASDIGSAIRYRFWFTDISHSDTFMNTSVNATGQMGVFTNITNAVASINDTYSLITVTARNPKNYGYERINFRNFYKPEGAIDIPAVVGESQVEPVGIKVYNNTNSTRVYLYLNIYNRNMSYAGAKDIGPTPGDLKVEEHYAFGVPSGYYILVLKDRNNNNYAGALFYLANANLTATKIDFRNATFIFSVQSNGFLVTNTSYTADLDGAYNYSGLIVNGTLNYTLTKGTIISYGPHNLNFIMFGTKYPVQEQYLTPIGGFYIPLIDIEIGVVGIVVVLLNLILKPPNRDEYYVDVPEFPPSKREKVSIQQNSILGVFDKVNYSYHWKYMPLTIDEVKFGIGGFVRVNNMPISVTVQNTNILLSELMKTGYLSNYGNYYAPKAWLDSSRHDIEYLVIFRRLRDYCVSHAILFTDIDADKNADMLITKEGKQSNIFIYTSVSGVRKIEVSNSSKSIIAFMSDDSRQEFLDKLSVSVGKDAEILRLGIDYNYVELVDVGNLDQLGF